MTALDLKGITAAGGIVDVSCLGFSALDLKGIAAGGARTGGGLIVRDAGRLTALDAKGIAAANPGHVTLVF